MPVHAKPRHHPRPDPLSGAAAALLDKLGLVTPTPRQMAAAALLTDRGRLLDAFGAAPAAPHFAAADEWLGRLRRLIAAARRDWFAAARAAREAGKPVPEAVALLLAYVPPHHPKRRGGRVIDPDRDHDRARDHAAAHAISATVLDFTTRQGLQPTGRPVDAVIRTALVLAGLHADPRDARKPVAIVVGGRSVERVREDHRLRQRMTRPTTKTRNT